MQRSECLPERQPSTERAIEPATQPLTQRATQRAAERRSSEQSGSVREATSCGEHGSRPDTLDVLVVDPSAESRDVFQTALSHRGWKILATSALDEALAVASGAMPSVVVIDGDVLENDATAAVRCQQLFRPTQSKTSLIILGRLSGDSLPVKAARIDKPYHYGPLIRRIEALCRSSSSRSDAGEESRD